MRTFRVTLTLGLLVAAAACGTPNNSAGNSSASSSASGVASTILPRPDRPPAQVNEVRPDSKAIELRAVPWTGATAGQDRQLVVNYTVGGLAQCNVLGWVDVLETTDTVTITVLVGRFPGVDCGGAQPQLAASYSTVVTLRQPLGTRVTRDGAS